MFFFRVFSAAGNAVLGLAMITSPNIGHNLTGIALIITACLLIADEIRTLIQ